MSNNSAFLDEGIIEIDGPGFVGDFEDEKGDFQAPRLGERLACPPHPGAILRDLYLPRTGVSLTDLAARIGVSRRSVSMIVNQTRPVTVDMAHRLARAFGTSSRFWLNLQRDVDDWKVLHERRGEYERITRLAA